MKTVFKAAALQAAPIYMNKSATIEKSLDLIEKASAEGVELLAFPELWCPGYPWWVWLGHTGWGNQFSLAYLDNAIERDGPELQTIANAAKEHNMMILFGYCERDGCTLYISQSLIGPDGRFIKHRRKLKPARTERYVFGQGDGSDLAVTDTEFGRVGALCCGEHYQPPLKCAMYAQQEQVHIASWPSFSMSRGKAFKTGPDAAAVATQMYSIEGQCFTLMSTMIADNLMVDYVCDTEERRKVMTMPGYDTCGGRAVIFSPTGEILSDPIDEGVEGMAIAEIDLGQIPIVKTSSDVFGHWARPDVVRLELNLNPAKTYIEHGKPAAAIGEE
nr:carbon-nitrogen hydrolase family protein [uncultured Cohaesibacter sp.]